MEAQEMNFRTYLHTLDRYKYVLAGLCIVSLVVTFLISNFMMEKKYETEMWIQISANFLSGEEKTSLQYIRSHFFYPEVVRLITNQEGVQEHPNLTLHETNGLIQIVMTHPKGLDSLNILKKWVFAVRLKMIEEEGKRLKQCLADDLIGAQTSLSTERPKLQEIGQMLAEKNKLSGQEISLEKLSGRDVIVIQGDNMGYADLMIQENKIRLGIIDLENKVAFMNGIANDYDVALLKIKLLIEDGFTFEEVDTVFEGLTSVRNRYNAYLQQKNPQSVNLSIQPFQIVSQPHAKTDPVSPNLKLNMLMALCTSLLGGLFIVFLIGYKQMFDTHLPKQQKVTL